MKNPVRTLLALALFSTSALFAQAQSSVKVAVVDLAKLYDSHFKTEEQNAKIQVEEQNAQQELDRLNKEGNALVEQLKEYQEQVNNPASTPQAKQKAQEAAQQKYEEIRKKQQEVQRYQMDTSAFLQKRINNFKIVMLEDISAKATEIAKSKGATLLLDKSGPSLIGVPSVIYFDSSMDITADVLEAINKDRPVSATPVAPAAPAAPAAAPASEAPMITVPGMK